MTGISRCDSFRRLFFSLAAITCLLISCDSSRLAAQDSVQDSPGTQKLFDGKTLDGWAGNDEYWSVEDGSIVGRSTAANPLPHNTFLIWQGGEVSDFKLRFRYKMEGGNSGVQIRSQVVGEYRVHGYQADFDAGNNYTGIWYDEGGRGILVPRGKQVTINSDKQREEIAGEVDEKTYVAGLRANDWNEVVITAKGNRLTHSINGNVSAVLIDNESEQAESSGVLALQLHQGPPMTIWFRDIELTVLKD